jgi:hypothetical protein
MVPVGVGIGIVAREGEWGVPLADSAVWGIASYFSSLAWMSPFSWSPDFEGEALVP